MATCPAKDVAKNKAQQGERAFESLFAVKEESGSFSGLIYVRISSTDVH